MRRGGDPLGGDPAAVHHRSGPASGPPAASQRGRRPGRHPRAAPASATAGPAGGDSRPRSSQGRRRSASLERRPADPSSRHPGPVHTGRRHRAAGALPPADFWPACRDRRPQRNRRATAGHPAPAARRDGDHLPLENPEPCHADTAGRPARRRRRPAGVHPGRAHPGWRDGHRRRDQSPGGRRGRGRGVRRRLVSRASGTGAGLHAGGGCAPARGGGAGGAPQSGPGRYRSFDHRLLRNTLRAARTRRRAVAR